MTVRRILEPQKNIYYRIYDEHFNEIYLIELREGELTFYKEVKEEIEEA